MNLANVKDNGEHGSSAQKSIWHSIRMLAPFEAVRVDTDMFHEYDLRKGEEEFYRFMEALYRDMYQNPAKYVIPTTPYDDYVNHESSKKTKVKEHDTDAKECKLRNTFQQAIQFYPELLYRLGLTADGIHNEDFALVISKEGYDNVLQSFSRSHSYHENERRLHAIRDIGIEMKQIKDGYHITCKPLPYLFLGLWVLCNAPDSKYKHMNYLRLDYKGYYRAMPGIEDVKLTLSKEHAERIDCILNSFQNLKTRYKVKPLRNITSGFDWKVEYTFNGRNFWGFYAEPDSLMLCLYFNHSKHITAISKMLANENPPLFHWLRDKFPERLCRCPNNRAVLLGDVKRRVCGLSNRADVVNPSEEDVKNSVLVMKMFRGLKEDMNL